MSLVAHGEPSLSLTEGEGRGEGAGASARTPAALASLQSAEELLSFFGIEFDPEALAPRRVRLLKRYGMSVRMIERIPTPLGEEERLRLHGEALRGQWERLLLEVTSACDVDAPRSGGCGACETRASPGKAA